MTNHRFPDHYYEAFCEPNPENIPTDARQDYLDKIAENEAFITKHPSYVSLCEQAQARIKFYQKRIAELDRLDKEAERMKGCLVAIQVSGDNGITACFDPLATVGDWAAYDPRTPEQKAHDEWCAEVEATRAMDYPI